MTLENVIKEEIEKTRFQKEKNKRIKRDIKVAIDSYLEPSIILATGNLFYLIGADKVLEQISRNADNYEGTLLLGSYTALIGGAGLLNKYVLNPIAQKWHNYRSKQFKDGKKTTIKNNILKNTTVALTIAGALIYSDIEQSIKNIKQDYDNVVTSLTRKYDKEETNSLRNIIASIPNNLFRDKIKYDNNDKVDDNPEFFEKENIQLTNNKEIIIENIEEENKNYTYFSPMNKERRILTGEIEGYKLASLFSLYTGIEGQVEKELTINFYDNLKKMWDMKNNRKSCSIIKELSKNLMEDYNKKQTLMSIDDYLEEISHSIKNVNENIDWDLVGKMRRLTPQKTKILKKIAGSLTKEHIFSYSLTEIMPSNEGVKNIAVYDFLLKNAGREFIESIPALYDNLPSFGPYQFTPFAVYDDGKERRGASIPNQALPEEIKIPNDVTELRGNDHHKAAVLFAIVNIADALRGINNTSKLNNLEKKYNTHMDDIVEYIATAHHRPSNARKAFQRWVNNDLKKSYIVSCDKMISGYAKKTAYNLVVLVKTDNNSEEVYIAKSDNFSQIEVTKKQEIKTNPQRYIMFTPVEINRNDGKSVYSYNVKKGKNPAQIIRDFEEEINKDKKYISMTENLFLNKTYENIVSSPESSKYVGNNIREGMKVYVLAQPKI
jgi:uncharacterized protein YoxC